MPPSPAPDAEPPVPGADALATADDVRRAQRGDVAAFERLYRTHVGRVTALCVRLTGERQRAEELMQDTFVRAWEKLGSFRGESTFATWLHRVTVNAFLHSERGDRRRLAHIEPAEDLDTLSVAAFGAGDPGDRIDLERAIAALPSGARMAFVLHEVEGYKHEEIAAMAGIAPATVRAQLFRARRLLMEALDR
ncbi:MAG TPA: RNA polymerase sigma factor [Gemmatimonadaceae bacterium]|nr:RNA polymerase sigma factor [Gemmatimonadaceae bacterium]